MHGTPHPADDAGAVRRHDWPYLRPVSDDETADEATLLEAIPEYPVSALTGPLRDFTEWAIRDGLPAASAGAAGLAALATVTARAELSLTSTFTVRPVVWVAPIGGTGTGKSGALEQAFAEITAIYDHERSAWAEQAKVARDGDAKVDVPPKPHPITLGDVTLPSAARWLQDNGGAGCLVYDELTTLLTSTAPADRAKLCEAWTARRPLHIQRVGDGGDKNAIDIYVSRPVLSVFGPLTPDNTKELGREGDGFRARWLPHLITGKAELRDGGPHPESWVKAIERLYHERETRRWTLTGRARTAYEKARQRWAAEQDEPYPQSVVEALRKADAQCARIALIIAESCETDTREYATADRGTIPLAAVKAAIALTDYVMDCWKALPGARMLTLSMADEKLSDAAQELFNWLEGRPKGTEGLPDGSEPRPRATSREITRARVGGACKAQMVSAMILEYEAQYPGSVVRVGQGGKGGGTGRVYVYFPARVQSNIAVTVTAIRAPESDSAPDETAGDGDGISNIAVTRTLSQAACDSDPVTAIGGRGGVVDEADGWPVGSYGDEAE